MYLIEEDSWKWIIRNVKSLMIKLDKAYRSIRNSQRCEFRKKKKTIMAASKMQLLAYCSSNLSISGHSSRKNEDQERI